MSDEIKLKKKYLTVRERLNEFINGLKAFVLMVANRFYVIDVPSGKRVRLSFSEAWDVTMSYFETALCGYLYEMEVDEK